MIFLYYIIEFILLYFNIYVYIFFIVLYMFELFLYFLLLLFLYCHALRRFYNVRIWFLMFYEF